MIVPRSLAEVDAAWLSAFTGEHFDSITVEPLPKGVGILSILGRIHAGDRRLVVKLASDDPVTFATSVGMRWYEREVEFYRSLAPFAGPLVPRSRGAALAPDGSFAIVLDDLTDSSVAVDQVTGLGVAVAEAVVDALAQVHSALSVPPTPGWLPKADDPRLAIVGPFCRAMWPTFAERFAGRWSPNAMDVAERFTFSFESVLARWAQSGHLVVTHGDVRGDNVLIRSVASGASTAVLLDWQQPALQSGLWDLAHLTLTSLTVEARRASERRLIERYRTATEGRSETESELWHEYKLAALMLVYKAVANVNLDPGTERGWAMMNSMSDRIGAAIDDLDLAAML